MIVTFQFERFILNGNNIVLFFSFKANLGLASHITVTISASDEAHGVFQFSNDSISVNGTEPQEGRSNVTLRVRPSYVKIITQFYRKSFATRVWFVHNTQSCSQY